jgi:myo-inositol-1(or 4)-monophosphatase
LELSTQDGVCLRLTASGQDGGRSRGKLPQRSSAPGRFDGFWEQGLSAWDIAAGTLLIRVAGGVITDFTGRDIGIEHTGVVAGNPAIHDWLLDLLTAEE